MIVRRGKDTGFFRSKEIVVVLDIYNAEFIIEEQSLERDGFWKDLVKGLQEQVDIIKREDLL